MISNCKNNKTFKLGKGVTNYDMRGVSNVIKYAGITFAVLSLFSLILPIYSTFIAEGESCNMVIRMYNLVEFSPLGAFVLTAPIALLILMLSKVKSSVKTIGIIVLLLLDCMALYRTISVAHSWINNIATGVVNSNIGCLIYAVFLILEMIFLWISCNHYSLPCAIYINVP